MKRICYFTIVLCLLLSGCASVERTAQNIWGSSVNHLENARVDALYDTIDCAYQECYEAIKEKLVQDQYIIFQERPEKGLIVVMGIPQAIDTTEVGVFLTPLSADQTEVEVSSLSSPAKKKLAEYLFPFLMETF